MLHELNIGTQAAHAHVDQVAEEGSKKSPKPWLLLHVPMVRKLLLRPATEQSLLQVHQAAVAQDRCCFVEARPLPQQAVANRARLQAEADAWLAELATPPPGNAEERQLWQVTCLFYCQCNRAAYKTVTGIT